MSGDLTWLGGSSEKRNQKRIKNQRHENLVMSVPVSVSAQPLRTRRPCGELVFWAEFKRRDAEYAEVAQRQKTHHRDAEEARVFLYLDCKGKGKRPHSDSNDQKSRGCRELDFPRLSSKTERPSSEEEIAFS